MCIPGNKNERGSGSHLLKIESTMQFILVWMRDPDLRLSTAVTLKQAYHGNSKPDKKKIILN